MTEIAHNGLMYTARYTLSNYLQLCVPDRPQRSIMVNPLTPNDHYSGRTAPLTSKCCILYTYSTNTGTEYFKHGI
jgi:hypothetical protein